MSKGKQRPPQYNRQSKGYQQNIYKKQMKEKDIKMPKQIDMEKWTKINRILGIVWIIAVFAAGIVIKWTAALIVILIGAAYIGWFFWYINKYMKDYLKAYKQMGIPKAVYIKQLRRGGTDEKGIARMSKMWDKIKVEE